MTRRELVAVVARSLARMDLGERVARALPRPRRFLRADVIAIGKAAPAMAAGVLDPWQERIARVLVVTSDGTSTRALDDDPRVELLRASHPLPDRRSVRAAERCLAFAARAKDAAEDRLLVVLVSGGASSLVCAPAPGIHLATKRRMTQAMLRSGATIQQINVVRKHLSRIKGGGLARAAGPVPVLTLVASDVIGGSLADVGSGPSVADPSSVLEARALLRRYAPAFADLPLVRTGRVPNDARSKIVASPEQLARVVANDLRAAGLRAKVLAPSQAAVADLAQSYVAIAQSMPHGSVIVRAAEPSVAVPAGARGHGGRSTHLAALVAPSLPRGVLFLAAATDGVDGTSGTAGAIVDASFADRTPSEAIARALRLFDTGPLHFAAKSALPLHPTGHNLADLHLLVRSASAE